MWIRRFTPFVLLVVALAIPIAARPQSAAEHITLGDEAHQAFDPAKALEHYEAALALEAENAVALGRASRSTVDVGEQLTEKGARTAMFRKGEQYARRAIAVDPNTAEYHFHLARALGRVALNVGVRDRVKFAVEIRSAALDALAKDSTHPGALHVMGVWNAEIMRLNGFERFFARNLLGGGVFGKANWKEAVSYMERAVAVDPQRLTHHLDLAMIYRDVGEKAKAREHFQFVIDGPRTDFNDPLYKREAEEALKRLK
jgi:tetratricopeptide (TPR) repeat protein